MNEVSEIVRENLLTTTAKHYAVRARRAVESEKAIWDARAYSLFAAAKLPAHRAKVILQLRFTQGMNPRFLKLCENL